MRLTIVLAITLALSGLVTAGAATGSPAGRVAASKIPALYKNCTNLNRKYPHGIGKAAAKDRTASGSPVTTFKRSTKLYNLAMSYNRGLDRDKDGVACEQE